MPVSIPVISLRVGVVRDSPWIFEVPPNEGHVLPGYSGFLADLFSYAATAVYATSTAKLNVTVVEPADACYGTFSQTSGRWNGLLGLLDANRIDLAVAPLTPTSARLASGFSFLAPFLPSGISLLTVAEPQPASLWSFLQPFESSAWWVLLSCVFVGAFSLWLADRLSPFGYYRTSKFRVERRTLGVWNSIYRAILTLLGKTTEPAKSWSTRTVFVALCFLQFFIMKSYVAKLTSMLASRPTLPVASSWSSLMDYVAGGAGEASDPPARGRFGVLANSAYEAHFLTNPSEVATTLRPYMVKYDDYEAGVADLRAGNLAAFAGTPQKMAFLALQPPCDLYAGVDIISAGVLSWAVSSNSSTPPHVLDALSSSLLRASEDGTVATLLDKWFSYDGSCASAGSGTGAAVTAAEAAARAVVKPVDLAGVTFVFIGFVVFAAGLLVVEWYVYRRRHLRGSFWRRTATAMGYIPDHERDAAWHEKHRRAKMEYKAARREYKKRGRTSTGGSRMSVQSTGSTFTTAQPPPLGAEGQSAVTVSVQPHTTGKKRKVMSSKAGGDGGDGGGGSGGGSGTVAVDSGAYSPGLVAAAVTAASPAAVPSTRVSQGFPLAPRVLEVEMSSMAGRGGSSGGSGGAAAGVAQPPLPLQPQPAMVPVTLPPPAVPSAAAVPAVAVTSPLAAISDSGRRLVTPSMSGGPGGAGGSNHHHHHPGQPRVSVPLHHPSLVSSTDDTADALKRNRSSSSFVGASPLAGLPGGAPAQ